MTQYIPPDQLYPPPNSIAPSNKYHPANNPPQTHSVPPSSSSQPRGPMLAGQPISSIPPELHSELQSELPNSPRTRSPSYGGTPSTPPTHDGSPNPHNDNYMQARRISNTPYPTTVDEDGYMIAASPRHARRSSTASHRSHHSHSTSSPRRHSHDSQRRTSHDSSRRSQDSHHRHSAEEVYEEDERARRHHRHHYGKEKKKKDSSERPKSWGDTIYSVVGHVRGSLRAGEKG